MFKREQVFASTLEYFQGDALAADVFVNKYCLQDDHGYYEVTPQKMHWRLAQEFARPDLKYKFKLDDLPSVKEGWTKPEYYEFYAERVAMYFHLIDRFKFVIPQGSPMSALGNPYQIQSASNCFAPGTEVHTKNGSKPIESVQIGDEVVTHKDRYRKVVQIHKNKLDKRRLYKFKAYRTPFICVTENHEFLSISKEQLGWGMSPQWNSIGYLRVGDYIQIPSNVESAETSRLDFGRNSEIRTKSNKKYMDARVLENLSDFTQHKIEIDGKTFVQITSKDLCEEEFEFVYTLGVEEDHSYSVEGLICKNCFVLPSVEDSYSQIMKTDQELAQLSKRRGGVGFDISKLRPEGAPVSNAAKTSSGIVSFMERFSNTTREVGQNGRRAALLMSCSVHHPDIEKFITIKSDRTKVTGANISVAITDEFMKAVIEDIDYEQRWPCEGVEPKIRRVKRARDIWDLIIKNAWENAEPGVIFIDKMRNYPGQHYDGYEIVSTNPCGEILLSPFDSCRLIAQNIYSYVTDPFTPEASFDWKLFAENTRAVAQMADNLVDLEIELINKILNKVENDPEPDDVKAVEKNLWMNIRRTAQEVRRCGVGLTALGDAIAALNMRYGSSESIEFCDQLGKVMAEQLHWRSIELAQERGPFLVWDYAKEKDDQYINEVILKDAPGHIKEMYMEHGRRNLAMLTIAPTGSVSTMTQTTSGCEPVFLIQYKRNRKIADNENAVVDFVDQVGDRWTSYMVDHHGFARFKKITGIEDPEKSPYWKSTSADVDWAAGVKIQATLQRYIDHSISKTCNLPNEATQELVSEVYLAAYKEGCKGFTVYRDGSRTGVLVAIDKKPEVSSNRIAKARKPYLPGQVHITKVKGQDFAVVLGIDEGMPYEVFGGRIAKEVVSQLKAIEHPIIHKIKISKNKSVYRILEGNIERVGDLTSLIDDEESGAVTRLVSLALRHGASPQFVAEQLKKTEEARFDSIGKALSRILKNFIPNGVETKEVFEDCKTKEQCSVVYQDGCVTCTQCGKSKCG